MPGENRLTVAAVRESREHAIATLQEAFARDEIDVDELERRVTLAHTAESVADIAALIADLTPLPADRRVPSATTALVPAADVAPAQTIRALMSATTRRGPWLVPRRLRVKTTMASTVLDFREARFAPGVAELELSVLMGSVEIIVPPGLAIDTHGSAIMGSFDDVTRAPAHPDPEAPLLRITGRALMGSVEVRMQLPGESAWQAHKRERRQDRLQAGLADRRADRHLRAETRDQRLLDRER